MDDGLEEWSLSDEHFRKLCDLCDEVEDYVPEGWWGDLLDYIRDETCGSPPEEREELIEDFESRVSKFLKLLTGEPNLDQSVRVMALGLILGEFAEQVPITS